MGNATDGRDQVLARARSIVLSGLDESATRAHSEARSWGIRAQEAADERDAEMYREQGSQCTAVALVCELAIRRVREDLIQGSALEVAMAARLPAPISRRRSAA